MCSAPKLRVESEIVTTLVNSFSYSGRPRSYQTFSWYRPSGTLRIRHISGAIRKSKIRRVHATPRPRSFPHGCCKTENSHRGDRTGQSAWCRLRKAPDRSAFHRRTKKYCERKGLCSGNCTMVPMVTIRTCGSKVLCRCTSCGGCSGGSWPEMTFVRFRGVSQTTTLEASGDLLGGCFGRSRSGWRNNHIQR